MTVYLHQEASSEVVAAAEGSTLAPNLDAAPGLGFNDRETSARSAILPVVDGTRGVDNPERQGLNSALFGEGDPLNVNQEVPGHGGDRYSPVWDVHPIVWTQAAIDAGLRERLTSNSEIANAFDKGLIVSGGTGRQTLPSTACGRAGSSPTARSSPCSRRTQRTVGSPLSRGGFLRSGSTDRAPGSRCRTVAARRPVIVDPGLGIARSPTIRTAATERRERDGSWTAPQRHR